MEEQAAEDGKVAVDYKPDVDYIPEGADPNDEPDAQEEKEEENSNAKYVKMDLPHQGTLRQQTMHR